MFPASTDVCGCYIKTDDNQGGLLDRAAAGKWEYIIIRYLIALHIITMEIRKRPLHTSFEVVCSNNQSSISSIIKLEENQHKQEWHDPRRRFCIGGLRKTQNIKISSWQQQVTRVSDPMSLAWHAWWGTAAGKTQSILHKQQAGILHSAWNWHFYVSWPWPLTFWP